MPPVSQRMSRVSHAMSRVSHAMARVSQRIGFSDLEQDFFQAGEKLSAGESIVDENDHDSWRKPTPRFSLKRSIVALVTLPAAVVRHFTTPREYLDLESVMRAVTGSVQRFTGPVQRVTGAIQRKTDQLPFVGKR